MTVGTSTVTANFLISENSWQHDISVQAIPAERLGGYICTAAQLTSPSSSCTPESPCCHPAPSNAVLNIVSMQLSCLSRDALQKDSPFAALLHEACNAEHEQAPNRQAVTTQACRRCIPGTLARVICLSAETGVCRQETPYHLFCWLCAQGVHAR